MDFVVKPIGGEFGVSGLFPTLSMIEDYVSKRIKLDRGYPRFVVHPAVKALIEQNMQGAEEFGVCFCSQAAARFCIDTYCVPGLQYRLHAAADYAIVYCQNSTDQVQLFQDCRNLGFTLSPRRAAKILAGEKRPAGQDLQDQVRQAICRYEQGSQAELSCLFPSGMAAIFAAVYAASAGRKGTIVMVASPYVDTRLFLEQFASRHGRWQPLFVDPEDFKPGICPADTMLIISEFFSNPHVRFADPKVLQSEKARTGAVLLYDATLATPYCFSPLEHGADMVMHSTTKFLNGHNDHIGGFIAVAPAADPALMSRLRDFCAATDLAMDSEEAAALLTHLAGFKQRMATICANTAAMAQWLSTQGEVAHVYYPTLPNHPEFALAKDILPRGAGGVLSFELRSSTFQTAAAFYDNCPLPGRGPSLGSEVTLLCPITFMSFYTADAERLAQIGQDRFTLRLSIGIENLADLQRDIRVGLDHVAKLLG